MKNIEDLKIVGRNLKLERIKRGLTQEQLAELSGISQYQHIGRIENATADIRMSTLFSILRALDIKLEDLIDLNN